MSITTNYFKEATEFDPFQSAPPADSQTVADLSAAMQFEQTTSSAQPLPPFGTFPYFGPGISVPSAESARDARAPSKREEKPERKPFYFRKSKHETGVLPVKGKKPTFAKTAKQSDQEYGKAFKAFSKSQGARTKDEELEQAREAHAHGLEALKLAERLPGEKRNYEMEVDLHYLVASSAFTLGSANAHTSERLQMVVETLLPKISRKRTFSNTAGKIHLLHGEIDATFCKNHAKATAAYRRAVACKFDDPTLAARSHYNLADALEKSGGDYTLIVAEYRKALAIIQSLSERHPEKTGYLANVKSALTEAQRKLPVG